MIFKTAFLYVTYRLLGVVKLSCFYDFSCTLITSENLTLMFTNTFIFFLFTDLCIFFFFWIFRNKTDRSCQTKSRRFFQLKSSELQTYHYNCDGVKIFESWKIILPVFYPSIKSKKKISNDFIFYFLEPRKYFVNF